MPKWGLGAIVGVLLAAEAAGASNPRPFKSDRLDKKYMCSQRLTQWQEECQRWKGNCDKYQKVLKDCARYL